MRKPTSSKVGTKTVKKKRIEIESDTVEVGFRKLPICSGPNASCNLSSEKDETNKTTMQIVCADDDNDSSLEYDLDYMKYLERCNETTMQIVCADDSDSDLEYMKYLTSFNENDLYLHERDSSPVSSISTVDDMMSEC